MTEFVDHASALNDTVRPAEGRRWASLGHRLAQTFTRSQAPEDPGQETVEYHSNEWPDDVPRFPVVRRGYHCASVDHYVNELEQELGDLDREIAALRAHTPPVDPAMAAPAPRTDLNIPSAVEPPDPVAIEIKRVGEQTSAVLIAAHEQAQETLRDAQAEAERRLAEASAEASAIVCGANQRAHDLEIEMQSLQSERERLLGDVRSAATALAELVEVSFARFPPT